MSKRDDRLEALSREERMVLCREVVEGLSDYVEGTAPEEFCRRIDRILGGCQPFEAYRNTLAATIRLAGECRDTAPAGRDLDNAAFERCVEVVRERLASDVDPQS